MSSRVALVTGASRGIGRAAALQLAADGHRVAVNYVRAADEAEAVVAAIQAAGGEALAIGADVGTETGVAELFAAIQEALGPVEILVNNAGVVRDNLVLRMTTEDWDDVLAVNLRSVFLCTKTALRAMLRARWGRVISMTSVSGLSGNAGQANYAAAKAGIVGFTKSVAKEVGSRGITVNAVAPGFIETDMTGQIDDDGRERVKEQISLGRFGTPEEISAAVGYLASEQAAYVTGQVLVVDGGLAI
ncbi:MAG: 3-oxoacyl-[acyl-carrier-protein] reductase [Acidimicrobiia bacterium]|nr:3-oxoacyl-[acyl-carrier-protein] reductase [Acidimicrobiia bacterium]